MTFMMTLPFLGKDTNDINIMAMLNGLNMGNVINIEVFENYDSTKKFRSANVTFSKLYCNLNTETVVEQLSIFGEIVVKLVTHKTSRWIIRAHRPGSLMGVRSNKNCKRVFIII